MGTCETCTNEYEHTFTITMGGETHTFDSFECAITALAPICKACGVRILGHGVESDGSYYCGAHCAQRQGVSGVSDRS